MSRLCKGGTTAGAAVFALGALGCSKPVEERTVHEKTINAAHKKQLNLAKEEKGDPYWIAARAAIATMGDKPLARPVIYGHRPTITRIVRGSHHEKTLLLTFDDGPHPASTLRLLKILADEHVPATFFVIGKMVEKHPDLLRAIQRAGQTIANHTFSHVTLTKLPFDEQRTEMRANNAIVEKITGERMRFFRPPGGDHDEQTLHAARAEGLVTVLWTDDPGDFANPGDTIVLDRTLKRLSNGGVILLHDGSPNTLDTLRELIHEARARGFGFTTPQDMIAGLEGGVKTRVALAKPNPARPAGD